MTDTFRALCAELLQALETEGYANWTQAPDEDELCLRARAALAAEPQRKDCPGCEGTPVASNSPCAVCGRAQPEPQGPSHWDVCQWLEQQGHWGDNAHRIPRIANMIQDALARWGRPAIEPVPKQEDIHYAWELHDAEGEWQAGGAANSLEDVQREGNRYLQTYLQDGPHKLIIERHCVTTIEPVPVVEGADA